jgi:Mg-chelatase subunit ChlD
MLDSVIHSAVLAAIFTGLETLRTRLVLFDTQVVDISDRVGDPVEVLLGVQLGGGTDIANAMDYAAGQVETPRRTLVVLITDFYEGGNPKRLAETTRTLGESGVRLLGLAALGERAEPDYDHRMAQKLANRGMEIGAMTPDQLADWVGRAIH